MTDAQFHLGWLWFFVLFTLSLFFILAERRYRGKGFGLFAMMILAIGMCSASDAAITLFGAKPISFSIARVALGLGLLASALNTHFLCVYFNSPLRRTLIWISYVLSGGGLLADLGTTVTQLETVSTLTFPQQYRSPSPEFTVYFFLVVLVQMTANVLVLYPAMRQKKTPARGMLISLLASAPVAFFEVGLIMYEGQRWYLVEACSWAYALIVIASLILEFQGTEGLLKQTTSSLAARTAELESSYAEIDLMASELSRKQQLAAVGELAAAIAHEVRNPLAIIMNAVSGMKRVTISETDRQTLLGIVNEESERLNQLVAELLRFARPVTAARSPTSLYDICQKASEAAPEGYEVTVQKQVEDELGPVLVDPGLFRLALDNLIANSSQAMPEGGSIALLVRQGRFSDGSLAAAVDVCDTGAGMAPHELISAKKPFFTTKPRGTGLGLPIAEKIVEAHGGEMSISSVVGRGTTVSILLPLERELQKGGTYSEGLKTSTRRRLRSIPPVSSAELNDVAPDLPPRFPSFHQEKES